MLRSMRNKPRRVVGVVGALALVALAVLAVCSPEERAERNLPWVQYEENPFIVRMEIPGPADHAGGMIVADLDNDGLMDYLVTVPGHIAAYAHDGNKLWIKKTDVRVGTYQEADGLPGNHGPGVQAGDVDGDGETEVLYLTRDGVLHVVDGIRGREEWTAAPPVPEGAQHWEHAIIADFRGRGDRDVLLQATTTRRYRTAPFLAAYRVSDLKRRNFRPLWTRDDFDSCAHNGARIADLDGDGRDEVLGQMLLNPTGETLQAVHFGGKAHADYVKAADVCWDTPGKEVVLLEEVRRNGKRAGRTFLASTDGLLWQSNHQNQEPQNAAVGDFSPDHAGLEVWCRSRHSTDQTPFVFDAGGKVIASWEMKEVAPAEWTDRGVEVIWTIDWTGEATQLCAAKERHTSGDVAIFDAIAGSFLHRFEEQADRLYVADVSGDWREELVVLNANELRIYHNDAPNPNPDRPRLWACNAYRRSKMTWNYYSP